MRTVFFVTVATGDTLKTARPISAIGESSIGIASLLAIIGLFADHAIVKVTFMVWPRCRPHVNGHRRTSPLAFANTPYNG